MSEVAEAAGAGVASVYRLYPSKYELYAALVVRRMDQIIDAARRAEAQPGDRWTGLTEMLRGLVAGQSVEPFVGEARALVGDHPDVIESSDALPRPRNGYWPQRAPKGDYARTRRSWTCDCCSPRPAPRSDWSPSGGRGCSSC